jgi:UMF1 family MFS transporter
LSISQGFATITSASLLFAKSDLNMPSSQVLLLGLVVPFCMAFSALLWPLFARRFQVNNLRMLLMLSCLALAIPIYACIGFVPTIRQRAGIGSLRNPVEIFLLAGYFGSLYGSFQSYARSVFADLVPRKQEARFFGLYSITSKSSAFFGPLLVGIAGQLTGSLRSGFVVIFCTLLLPLPLLASLDMQQGRVDAQAW